jgi:hypothetical protein
MPPFPAHVLPDWLRDWTIAESEFAQVPSDFPALLGLAVVSLACSRHVDVQVRKGWSEPTNLWVVCAAESGERKSQVYKDARAPITAYQKMVNDQLAPQVFDYQTQKEIFEKQIKAGIEAASKNKTVDGRDPMRCIAAAREALTALPEVSPLCLTADDITPEAAGKILAANGERLGVFSSEGGPF